MPLDIDLTRAFRPRARLTEFVQAILDAPKDTQEVEFVEWKTRPGP